LRFKFPPNLSSKLGTFLFVLIGVLAFVLRTAAQSLVGDGDD
jgi:hypothetical protein